MTIASAPGRRKAMGMLLAPLALAGCALPPPAPCAAVPDGPLAWVVDQGWHTEIALRAEDLSGPLADLRTPFPGAETLVFGFGKRGFMLAEAGEIEELLLGPLPGPGVIQVRGMAAPPSLAWPGRAIALPLPERGLDRLRAFLWNSIAADAAALPLHDSLFYEAARGYSLLYTCNTWTAEGLRQAGLPVRPEGVVLARAVLAQLRPLGCGA